MGTRAWTWPTIIKNTGEVCTSYFRVVDNNHLTEASSSQGSSLEGFHAITIEVVMEKNFPWSQLTGK